LYATRYNAHGVSPFLFPGPLSDASDQKPKKNEVAVPVPTRNLSLAFIVTFSCASAESKNAVALAAANSANTAVANSAPQGATIPIDANGPADTVRVFYKLLREKKFREAIFLTNLKPAIEGLTDNELKDFAVDLEAMSGEVPAEIKINGEIISGDSATVTANMPDLDSDKEELQQIKLRKQGEVWIIQTVDEEAEKRIKAEGKQYFYNLRIETHEDEAKKMLERISKAELAHSLQNGGVYTDMQTLVAGGLLPPDVTTSASTGYNFVLTVSSDKKTYSATATPSEYGKSGKLSYLLTQDGKGIPRVTGKDNGGKTLAK